MIRIVTVFSILVFFCLFPNKGITQTSQVLNLEGCITIALKQNPEFMIAKKQLEKSQAEIWNSFSDRSANPARERLRLFILKSSKFGCEYKLLIFLFCSDCRVKFILFNSRSATCIFQLKADELVSSVSSDGGKSFAIFRLP